MKWVKSRSMSSRKVVGSSGRGPVVSVARLMRRLKGRSSTVRGRERMRASVGRRGVSKGV